MLILIEVPLDEFFEISESHLPRLGFLQLHLVESGHSQTAADMFLKAEIEEGTAAQPTRAHGRLFYPQRLQGNDFVRDQTNTILACITRPLAASDSDVIVVDLLDSTTPGIANDKVVVDL